MLWVRMRGNFSKEWKVAKWPENLASCVLRTQGSINKGAYGERITRNKVCALLKRSQAQTPKQESTDATYLIGGWWRVHRHVTRKGVVHRILNHQVSCSIGYRPETFTFMILKQTLYVCNIGGLCPSSLSDSFSSIAIILVIAGCRDKNHIHDFGFWWAVPDPFKVQR